MSNHMATAGILLGLAPAALGATSVTQGTSASTHDVTLNFDEPGGPVGAVTTDAWSSTHGVTIDAGDGVPAVGDYDEANGGWGLGDGMCYFGNFGVFMTFENDLTALSAQVWDPSGPPSPFGGGLGVFVFNDGVEVGNWFGTPAWGGIGDTWFDITATEGDVFDEVRILGFGFNPWTYVDDLSWQTAAPPCPEDTDGSGDVDVDDLIAVITAWGTNDPAADVNGSGLVDVDDLVAVVLAWGSC